MSGNHPRLLRYARKSLLSLDQNRDHRQAANHALSHYASGAVYSFIPKNACSTLRVSLAIANGCIADPTDFAWIHHNNHTFMADLRALVTAPYTFAILRCPYRRLVSVFLDKIVSRTNDFWDLHRASSDRLDPNSLSFRGFVAAISNSAIVCDNIHWRPQSSFLVYETYDDIFRMEDFTTLTVRLKDRIGFDLVDARRLTAHGTDSLIRVGGIFADTPAAKLLDMRRCGEAPTYAAFYDPALVSQVAGLYWQDINLYEASFGPKDLAFPEGHRKRIEET